MLKVIHFDEAERYEPEKNWQRVSLCNQEEISIEHFVKPPLHKSPEHAHDSTQILVVLSGRIRVETEASRVEAGKGDAIYIGGGESHIVSNLLEEPSSGLDIFVPGRSFDFWLRRKSS